jgi:enoyl-CoA hydratase/carnithine racemase
MDDGAAMNQSRIATVTISGSEGNLLNPAIIAAIVEALTRADGDPAVSGIVITGAGDVFCAGLDIAAIRAGADPMSFAAALVDLLKTIPRLSKPLVARVNGDAVASGASIVAACDYAVAVASASIGTREVSVGIWPMVAQVPLIKRLGAGAAMENLGSGVPFTAERAREIGLVNRVVRPEDLDEACGDWLAAAARGTAAAAVGRPMAYELDALPYDAALDHALRAFSEMFRSG